MIVVVLNGFLGKRKKHVDVTELVQQALPVLPDTKGLTLIQGRGGAGIVAFNRIYKKLARASKHDEVLLLVGKSYGAHWCVRLLWKLADREKLFGFRAVAMVTVDPAFTLSRMQRKTRPIPKINYAKNFHQYGYRSGYKLGPPAENFAIRGTHKTIERDPRIFQAIEDLLLWGRAKSRRS
jgi:hypothetical protein